MEKSLTQSIPFGSSGKATAQVTVSMYHNKINLDGDVIVTDKVVTYKNIKVIDIVSGRTVVSSDSIDLLTYRNNGGFYKAARLDTGHDYTRVGDKAVTIGHDTGKAILAALEAMEKELALVFGVKTEAEKQRDREIRDAKQTIKAAQKEGIKNLMTNAEYKKWHKQYNDFYNEGGEGYIPDKTTKEEYQYALSVLNKYGVTLEAE